MTDKSNTEMLLPQAGIPGYIPQPKKNASEDVIGEYKKQVQPVSYTHLTLPTNREV